MSLTLNGNFGAVYQPDVLTAGNIVDADATVTNSATLVTVPQLTIPIGANERVLLRYNIQFNATAAGDFKYFVDAPASPTLFRQGAISVDPAGAVAGGAILTAESNTASVVSASAGGGLLLLNVIVANGTTAGNITFSFAQNTATASEAAIVRAGSYLEYRYF
jgi:hypothetical protein